MRAVVWTSAHDVKVENVPDPKILNPHDAIIQVTSTAICGSDLHVDDGYVPTMKKGDILGHEFMGRVVEVGPEVTNLQKGDRGVVPFPIACGQCFFCKRGLWSLCANTNPNAYLSENMFGVGGGAIYGYSHLMGGYAGGQAEYVRVPFANVGPLRLPDDIDDQVLFLSDILPTGYMAAENCSIQPGDTVAVFGCGPVGQFAMQSARLLGAERVIGIDRFDYRLQMAEDLSDAETLNYEEDQDVVERLKSMTGGLGPDSVIEAVRMEAHGLGVEYAVEKAAQVAKLETGRPIALRQAIMACRPGGTVSVPDVYGGFIDMFPMGAVMNKALTIKSGQTHVQKYMKPLLDRIQRGEINPSRIITHRLSLDDAPKGYKMFKHKEDNCEKVVLKP